MGSKKFVSSPARVGHGIKNQKSAIINLKSKSLQTGDAINVFKHTDLLVKLRILHIVLPLRNYIFHVLGKL
jgi:hypothetical protein